MILLMIELLSATRLTQLLNLSSQNGLAFSCCLNIKRNQGVLRTPKTYPAITDSTTIIPA